MKQIINRKSYNTNTAKKVGIIEVENTGERKVSINGEPAPDGIYQLNRYESIEVIDGKVKTNI